MRVYCKDCKHRGWIFLEEEYRCKAEKEYRDTANKRVSWYVRCERKNANNQCEDFEQKEPIFYRLARWILEKWETSDEC